MNEELDTAKPESQNQEDLVPEGKTFKLPESKFSKRTTAKWMRNIWHRKCVIPPASNRRRNLDKIIDERREINKNPRLRSHEKKSLKPHKIMLEWLKTQMQEEA